MPDVDVLYMEHLTASDLRFLARCGAAGRRPEQALGDPAVEEAVFRELGDDTGLAVLSPFLVFAVAVHRSAAHLATATWVEEWVGPRQRVPVFDVQPLRTLLDDPMGRYFFVELLSSYTHVASGVRWERTGRGWRRRRFSELDPVRLAGLLESVGPAERPGVFRRLGDLALFLTGVFPDHTAVSGLGPLDAGRLLRLSGVRPDQAPDQGGVALLELLGARWYRAAAAEARWLGPPTGTLAVAATLGERFVDARRVLNVVTDRFLFPVRDRWFGR